MAEPVPVLAPDGTPGTVPAEEVSAIEARGGRVLSPEEAAGAQKKIAVQKEASSAFNPPEAWLAGQHAAIRGVGEAFGVPVDTAATGIASLFGEGAKESTRKYLQHLDESNPLLTKWMGLTGNAQGALGAAELAGVRAPLAAARGGTGVAARMAYGGVENVIQSTTRDVNESSLGNTDLNGEKLLANVPKHFLIGAGAVGLFEGAGAAFSGLSKRAIPVAEKEASRAIGREVGESGEGAVAAGARVQSLHGGEIPKSPGELVKVLETEQWRLRGVSKTEHGVRVAEAEAAGGEKLQEAVAKGGRSVDQAIGHFDTVRQALEKERASATEMAEKIAAEREGVAADLGKAMEAAKGGPAKGEKLTPAAFDEIVDTYLGIMGRGGKKGKLPDPATKWAAEEHLRKVYAKEIEAGATASSEGATHEVTRLQALAGDLEKAHAEALKNVKTIDSLSASLEKEAERTISQVGRAADKNIAGAKRGIEKEIRSVPGPSQKTSIDPLIEGAKGRAREIAAKPLVSSAAGFGALISAVHGNLPGAAMSLASSFAANRVRAQGNYLLARSLRGLSSQLSSIDQAVQRGAASVVGFTAARGVEPKHGDKKPKSADFEDVKKRILIAQSNPLMIEQGVRSAFGPFAKEAPKTYASVLAASARANDFLASKLPKPHIDEHSLTPHLEPKDISRTQKYEFMRYVSTVSDPLTVFRDVEDGSVTEEQIEAVKAVYPALFKQMQAETLRHIATLDKPLPYKRAIHVGTLLEIPTNEVLDKDFQSTLQAAYEDKASQGAPVGSKPRSAESKTTKQMMSASEKVEAGEP